MKKQKKKKKKEGKSSKLHVFYWLENHSINVDLYCGIST